MIKQARNRGCKRPPIELAAVFEPHERFQVEIEVSTDHVSFSFAEGTMPLMEVISAGEAVIIHKRSTLGQPELVAKDEIQNINTLKSRKNAELNDAKDTKFSLKLFKNSIDSGESSKQKRSSLN